MGQTTFANRGLIYLVILERQSILKFYSCWSESRVASIKSI